MDLMVREAHFNKKLTFYTFLGSDFYMLLLKYAQRKHNPIILKYFPCQFLFWFHALEVPTKDYRQK